VLRSRAWQKKQLQTAAASWAELRHDTILYAKQSYSGSIICEYPEGYVEPYPAFFATPGNLARAAAATLGDVDLYPPYARYLLVAIDSQQDRAVYVGPAYSYYEFTSPMRLTDEEWEQKISTTAPASFTAGFALPPARRTMVYPSKAPPPQSTSPDLPDLPDIDDAE
jgi:hypothetical protein